MRDYKFGEFIYRRRTALSLSQYQLGRLLGVSDKAVSKWENGASKPKSALLPKLAEALEVSTDELLRGEYEKGFLHKEVKLSETEIFELARVKLKELYGDKIPLRASNRFNKEIENLKGSFLPELYYLCGEISAEARANQSEILNAGAMGGSFIAYLFGASYINPLAPHYLCPNCKSVIFVNDAHSPWDLPKKICACGHHMNALGHNIPFEALKSEIRCGYATLSIPSLLTPRVMEIIKDFARGVSVICVLSDEESVKSFKPYRFFFVPDGNGDFKTIEYSESAIYDLYSYPHLSINEVNVLNTVSRLYKECNVSEIEISKDLLSDFLSLDTKGVFEFDTDFMRGMLEKIKPQSFYELSKISGLAHSTGAWLDVGEDLVSSGVKPLELIAFRDDVFDYVSSAMGEIGIFDGSDFAFKVMNDTRRGIYNVKGMGKDVLSSLSELPLPSWFIPSLSKIMYLFPKAHSLCYVRLALTFMWFKRNFPKEFNRIVLN